jgi:putative redox protein
VRPLVKVTWDGAVRFTADIRGHKVHVDQPRQGGGEDSAPGPLELLPASLGTCVAYFVQQFLATRGVDTTGLEVEVGVMGAANPHRIGRFDVRVVLPGGVPERYREHVARVAETCTVHHTLTNHPEILVEVAEGVAAG